MCTTKPARRGTQAWQRGFTLIELIIFIVVVSAGLAGILSVMNTVVKSSADPMLRKQSIAIAESMLEEVLLKEYDNPSFVPTLNPQDRTTWNLVADANGYAAAGIKNPDNSAIVGLEKYNIAVSVVAATIADNAQLAALAKPAYKVTVTVTDPGANTVKLVGYRASY